MIKKIKRALKGAFAYYSRFGWKGLKIYVAVNRSYRKKVSLASHDGLVLRPGKMDQTVFYWIIVKDEFNFKFPFNNPRYIVDAGANIGISTYYFSKTFPEATVIAIEPDDENFESILSNTKSRNNVVALKKALWHKEEPIVIKNPTALNNSFQISSSNSVEDQQLIQVVTADQLLKDSPNGYIDLFKIDIEGAEREIFESDVDWLAKVKVLMIEIHDQLSPGASKNIFSAMNQFDFSCTIFGAHLLFVNQNELNNSQ